VHEGVLQRIKVFLKFQFQGCWFQLMMLKKKEIFEVFQNDAQQFA
jgi:hypothetical protein